MAKHAGQEHIVFEDNRLIPVLYGEQDAHLRKIEKAIGVEINNRGNEIVIHGDEPKIKKTKQVLEALWLKIQSGQEVDSHVVDSALRFLDSPPAEGKKEKNGFSEFSDASVMIDTKKKKIQPRTPLQADYVQAMKKDNMVFGVGPAGTGKTYLAVAMAVAMLEEGVVERIILSRPAVEAGERLGFLPGEMKEKMDPYMRPLYDALHDTMSSDKLVKRLATEEIEIAPLAFMRGRTLNNAFIILDEGQNATTMQMLMFLTRMGENSHMVITGDPSQIDLPKGTKSGLVEATEILDDVDGISLINFSYKDVVRNKLVTKVIQAYDAKRKD